MERNFDISNFEESLRQHADDFIMVPSKRVWNGIYNDLHPGSKWPSLTIALFFLMALMGIGYWNHSAQNSNSPKKETTKENKETSANVQVNKEFKSPSAKDEDLHISPAAGLALLPVKERKSISSRKDTYSETGGLVIAGNFTDRINKNIWGEILSAAPVVHLPRRIHNIYADALLTKGASEIQFQITKPSVNTEDQIFPAKQEQQANHQPEVELNEQTVKPATKKNRDVEWLFYITPAISSVYFEGKPIKNSEPVAGALPLILTTGDIGNAMRVNARIGMSAGAQIKVKLNEKLKLLSGAQISMGGYNILANRVHPTFAYLVLREKDGSFSSHKYMTFYGNGSGEDEIMLHNTNLQLSFPVGLEQSIWKNENVEISIAATIEPAITISGEGYILSADGRNFVSDDDLMRSGNMNGQLGSFITFSSRNVKWQVGPTLNYQLISSYKNLYPVKEHLVDYGIRIGITK